MTRRLLFFALMACGAVAGCTNAQKSSASQDLDAAGTETSASFNKMRGYFDVAHQPKVKFVKPAQPRYCYKTYQDVICYTQPIPGEEYRLVGFQTPDGRTGYTMDAEDAGGVPGGTPQLPLPPLKSVTVMPPPVVKGDDGVKEIIFDPAELQPKELVPERPQ